MANRHQDEISRAEQVRARREQKRKDQPRVPLGGNVTRKPKAQNITVTRRTAKTAPMVTRKKNTTYIPLNKKGAELQIPALPRLQLGWRIISGAIFLLSLVAIISFSSMATFRVQTIHLKGAQRLSPDSVFSQLNLADTSIFTIEPEVIKEKVEINFPGIKNVQVSIGLPAKISIQVEEREPLILWEQEGSSKWIDAFGVVFPVFGEVEDIQKVIADGNPPPALEAINLEIDDETIEISHQLEEIIPRTTPKFVETVLLLNSTIPEGSQLQYNPQFGLGWQDPNGWLVYFGQDTTDIDTKLNEYQEILASLEQRNITPALISLEFIHAPFYRLEH